ncbi:MAG: hypothetical protein JXB07_15625 [Anaerolineae bacterium]|nr:hypothetical protein [Anaerolineae bacterium]
MNTKNAHKITPIAIIAICLVLAGCASPGAATPTATQPPRPTAPSATTIASTETTMPTATSVATSIPAPTQAQVEPTQVEPPTPKDTPIPTATNYPAPAVPLSTTGPWLVFRANAYLWAMNQDGTGLTRLTDDCVTDFAVHPNSSIQGGLTIAYSTSIDGKCEGWYRENPPGLIKILSAPKRNVKTIVYDLSQGAEDLVWSPGGTKLAFIGAMGDTESNVFVYDVGTEEATRIAVTDYNDCSLSWSPDECYVIHQTGCGCSMGFCGSIGLWASRADAGGVTQLIGDWEHGWVLGWLSPTESIVVLNQWVSEEIRVVNIETSSYKTLFSESYLDMAYSPEHNMFLMTKETAPAPNRLLVFYQNGERREVTGYTIKEVKWLSAYDAFLGQTPDGRVFLISPDGTVVETPTHKWDTYDAKSVNSHSVIVSPDHQWWAQCHSRSATNDSASELWVGLAKDQPSVRLSTSLGTGPNDSFVRYYDVIWSPDSQHLLWLSGERLFAAVSPNFEATMVAELPGYSYLGSAVWVQ